RRDYVLQRMRDNGFIKPEQYKEATAAPELASPHEPPIEVEAPYIAELVRLEALQRLGNSALTDAYTIRTTIDSTAQTAANEALREQLMAYDQRHGFRGAEAHVELPAEPSHADLDKKLDPFHPVHGLVPAIVTASGEKSAQLYTDGGETITLDAAD